MHVDTSEKGTIAFTVESPNDVVSILPQFTYLRKQVIIKKRRGYKPLSLTYSYRFQCDLYKGSP